MRKERKTKKQGISKETIEKLKGTRLQVQMSPEEKRRAIVIRAAEEAAKYVDWEI